MPQRHLLNSPGPHQAIMFLGPRGQSSVDSGMVCTNHSTSDLPRGLFKLLFLTNHMITAVKAPHGLGSHRRRTSRLTGTGW